MKMAYVQKQRRISKMTSSLVKMSKFFLIFHYLG